MRFASDCSHLLYLMWLNVMSALFHQERSVFLLYAASPSPREPDAADALSSAATSVVRIAVAKERGVTRWSGAGARARARETASR